MLEKILLYLIKFLNKLFDYSLSCLMILCLLYGLYGFHDTYTLYNHYNDETVTYKPESNNDTSFNTLRNQYSDICAWITIDNTNIDYPILQGQDNSTYLNKDYKKDYALIGSVFLDYRNHKDFSDFYNLLYAHSMNGNCMFGMIPQYLKEDFFHAHKTGSIYIDNQSYQLNIFASMSTDAYDTHIYYPHKIETLQTKEQFLNYIKNNATFYSPISLSTNDHIVAMSTCSYDTTNGRIVVFAKIEKT